MWNLHCLIEWSQWYRSPSGRFRGGRTLYSINKPLNLRVVLNWAKPITQSWYAANRSKLSRNMKTKGNLRCSGTAKQGKRRSQGNRSFQYGRFGMLPKVTNKVSWGTKLWNFIDKENKTVMQAEKEVLSGYQFTLIQRLLITEVVSVMADRITQNIRLVFCFVWRKHNFVEVVRSTLYCVHETCKENSFENVIVPIIKDNHYKHLT